MTPLDELTCDVVVGADSLDELALWTGLMGLPFTVHEPPELVVVLRRLAGAFQEAADRS